MGKGERVRMKVGDFLGKMGVLMDKVDGALEKVGAYRIPKLETLLHLTVSRLQKVKNKHLARCSAMQNEVAQLLRHGYHKHALVQAECVVREQDMFWAFVMVEVYCNLLMESAFLTDRHDECPEELREAITGLIFAASRCKKVPELHDICSIFMVRFGYEFVNSVVELHKGCGVNVKMIRKLSNEKPSLESRVKVISDIASEKGIPINLEEFLPEHSSENIKEINLGSVKNVNQLMSKNKIIISTDSPRCYLDKDFSETIVIEQKYKSSTYAPQPAFKSDSSATDMELPRSESEDKYSDDLSGSFPSGLERLEYCDQWNDADNRESESDFDKRYHVQTDSSESENEEAIFQNNPAVCSPESRSDSSARSSEMLFKENKWRSGDSFDQMKRNKTMSDDYEYDDAAGKEWDFKGKSSLRDSGFQKHPHFYAAPEEDKINKNEGMEFNKFCGKQTQTKFQANSKSTLQEQMPLQGKEDPVTYYLEESSETESLHALSEEKTGRQNSTIGKKPHSVRTRRSGLN